MLVLLEQVPEVVGGIVKHEMKMEMQKAMGESFTHCLSAKLKSAKRLGRAR